MISDVVRARLLKGIGANLYGQAVIALIQVIGVPVLLYAWGTRTYGEWLILFAIPGYLAMTDLGFAISAANDMTAQVARGNRAEALRVFQSINALIALTSLSAFALALALIWSLPIGAWLHLGTLSPWAVRWVLLLLCTDVLVKLFDGINHAGFRANGDYALHVSISNTRPILQQLAVWVCALAGYGPLAAAIAYLIIGVCTVCGTAILLALRHRWLRFGVRHARLAELRRLLAPALANLALPLATALNIQGMVLIVAALLGPVAVVAFSTTRTLTRLALQLVMAVSSAAEPEFAALASGAGGLPLAALYSQTMRLSLWLASGAVTALAVFGAPLLQAWTRGHVIMNPGLFAGLLATVVSQTIWHGAVSMLRAQNRHVGAAGGQVVAAAAAVAMAGVLLHLTGNIAFVGCALFLSDATYMVFTMIAVEQALGVPLVQTFAAVVDPRPLKSLLFRTRHV